MNVGSGLAGLVSLVVQTGGLRDLSISWKRLAYAIHPRLARRSEALATTLRTPEAFSATAFVGSSLKKTKIAAQTRARLSHLTHVMREQTANDRAIQWRAWTREKEGCAKCCEKSGNGSRDHCSSSIECSGAPGCPPLSDGSPYSFLKLKATALPKSTNNTSNSPSVRSKPQTLRRST